MGKPFGLGCNVNSISLSYCFHFFSQTAISYSPFHFEIKRFLTSHELSFNFTRENKTLSYQQRHTTTSTTQVYHPHLHFDSHVLSSLWLKHDITSFAQRQHFRNSCSPSGRQQNLLCWNIPPQTEYPGMLAS